MLALLGAIICIIASIAPGSPGAVRGAGDEEGDAPDAGAVHGAEDKEGLLGGGGAVHGAGNKEGLLGGGGAVHSAGTGEGALRGTGAVHSAGTGEGALRGTGAVHSAGAGEGALRGTGAVHGAGTGSHAAKPGQRPVLDSEPYIGSTSLFLCLPLAQDCPSPSAREDLLLLRTTAGQLRQMVSQQEGQIAHAQETIRELTGKLSRCESGQEAGSFQNSPEEYAWDVGRSSSEDGTEESERTVLELEQNVQSLKDSIGNLENNHEYARPPSGTEEAGSGGAISARYRGPTVEIIHQGSCSSSPSSDSRYSVM